MSLASGLHHRPVLVEQAFTAIRVGVRYDLLPNVLLKISEVQQIVVDFRQVLSEGNLQWVHQPGLLLPIGVVQVQPIQLKLQVLCVLQLPILNCQINNYLVCAVLLVANLNGGLGNDFTPYTPKNSKQHKI